MPQLFPGIHTIDDVAIELMGAVVPVHPVLIEDQEGLTLIDTGPVGSEGPIRAYLDKLGYAITDIARIIVTHHHSDHTGALARLAGESGAIVAAHEEEVPILEGRVPAPARPLSPGGLHAFGIPVGRAHYQLEREWEEGFTPPSVTITEPLSGGDQLPILDGLLVLHTPGHSPGHIVLYSASRSLLFASDLFTYNGQELHVPLPIFTQDAGQSLASARAVVDAYTFNAAIPYHGAPLMNDAAEQLRRAITGAKASSLGQPLPGQVITGG